MIQNQVTNSLYFILLCCFSLALGFDSALIGPQYCGEGQVAWCQNFSTAVDCNAVKHCVQSVWLTQQSLSNVPSCGSCESEIGKLRRKISFNSQKEYVRQLLKNVCKVTFVTDLFPEKCETDVSKYVDGYFNDLLDLLKSDVNSATLCRILGFCVNERSPKIDEGIVVRYKNYVLHFPANFIDIRESALVLGSKKCTWGPSYWCKNITSSKECHSTSDCIQHIWQTTSYSEDDDSICKICKDMVKQARDQLQSNETQEELREVFEGSCKLIPIKEVRNECIKLADEFVPELTEMLVSEMNPTAICTVAGLCNSERIDNLLMNAVNAPTLRPSSCANCTAAVTGLERYLLHAPQNEVLDRLLRLCDQLSSFSDFCTSMVISNFAKVYNFLVGQIHPFPVCHLSGMCAHQYHLHPSGNDTALQDQVNAIFATANDDLPCDLCKQLVKHFKDVLTTNTTENEFLEILEGICKQTGKFQQDCLEIVDNNFKKIYKFLTEELEPSEVCREVNLCPRTNMVTDENLNLIYGRPSTDLLSVGDKKTAVSTVPESMRSVECRICRSVLSVIQKEIDKPEYKRDIEKLLSKVCSLVPRSDKDKCNEFIRDYADVLINILSDQTDPGVVCSLLKLCTEVPAQIDLCPLCKQVMNLIKKELDDPKEEQKVEDLVEHICRLMPKSEAQKCESFISNYTSFILTILAEEVDPSVVCPALKLCPSYSSPRESCMQCQHMMTSVIRLLNKDHSANNVVKKLDYVTSTRQNMAITALQLKVFHREDIIDMMGAEFNALESCSFLHFCDATSLAPENNVAQTDFLEESNEVSDEVSYLQSSHISKPSCEVCELLVQMYEDKLTSNVTEKEIVDELHKFCNKIKNAEFRSTCSHFVDEYVPKIVKLLKEDVKPVDVCRALKLCTVTQLTAVGDARSQRCEFCEAVVGSSEGILSDPVLIHQSIVKLIKLCHLFGDKDEALCMKVISYVGPQLESIVLGIPSWYYCAKIDMCPYGAHLTYKKVCTNQLDWCLDAQTALLCDKVEYCQLNVWKSEKPSL